MDNKMDEMTKIIEESLRDDPRFRQWAASILCDMYSKMNVLFDPRVLANCYHEISIPVSDKEFTIENFLNMLGFSWKHQGTEYIRKGILLFLSEGKQRPNVTKDFYPRVARECGVSHEQVERSIRFALKAAWEQKNYREEQNKFFPRGKPTNTVLLELLLRRLGPQQEGQYDDAEATKIKVSIRIKDILEVFGFSEKHSGTEYIAVCVRLMLMKDGNTKLSWKDLFSATAKECETDSECVQKNITAAIEKAWSNSDAKIIKAQDDVFADGKPKKYDFISKMVEILKSEI